MSTSGETNLIMRTSKIITAVFLVIFIVYAMCFSPGGALRAEAAEAPTEGTSHDLPDTGGSSSSSTTSGTSGGTSTPVTIRIEDDDDDDDDDDDGDYDDTDSIRDTEYYYDEEYDINEPEPEQPQPEQPQTPTNGSGGNGGGHSLDSTPKTADGDIDPRFVFCLALFLVGLGTVIYSRQKRLTYVVGKHSRDDELD